MAERKKNDIIEQQRKAREEFLKLKKMQRGEIAPEPKPSETAEELSSAQKRQNFWFYNKWNIFAIVVTVIFLAVSITQCARRPKYDLEVVYFSYTAVDDSQLTAVEEYFEKFGEDIDGNGEVNIKVVNCSVSTGGSTVQYTNQVYTKIQSMIVADDKAMLFITDKESYKYFDNISKERPFFAGEPLAFAEDFYNETKTDGFGELTEGLQISCREIYENLAEKRNDFKANNESAKKMMEKLKADINK